MSGPNAGLQHLAMNADGTGRRRLTNPDGADGSPTRSPDGRWIAVVRILPTPTGPSGALGPIDGACPSELAWRPAPRASTTREPTTGA